MAVGGAICLAVALAICLYGIAASLHGARSGRRDWVASGRRSVYALAGVLAVAMAILQAAFVRSDFSFALVAGHSSTTTPLFYRLTAVWSSQEGSLLLWVLLLALWSSAILFLSRSKLRAVAPYATAVLLGFGAFFCALLVFLESPFDTLAAPPAEGVGLNPLLRHPSMMIHPPMLYSGYTLFAVPFAFAVGALVTRRLGAEWIRATRPFTLGAWLLLGMGIVLGARWSYMELGWGGYWAWDPVENASLMPWLTGTAFLHSVMIQERRGMLKVWNVSLVLATGVLAILGTFLVRSGILDSIHAFGASTLGVPFLALIVTMVAGSIALVASRASELRSEHRLDSLLSRESVFLLNNLVLVAMCFVIFWGTFFPLISEAVTGEEASVGPPWFDQYTVPLALLLVLLSGIGPVIAWRRATASNLRRNLLKPALAGLIVLAGLSVLGVCSERAAVLFVGIAASSSFQDEKEVLLSPGQTAKVGAYEVTYVKPTADLRSASNGRLERIDFGANLRVTRDGEKVADMRTVKSYFPSLAPFLGPISRFFEGEATSEVGLKAGWRRDVWMAIAPDIDTLRPRIEEGDKVFADAELSPEQRDAFLGQALAGLTRSYANDPPPATFRLIVSPMVTWIWLGAILAFLGGLIALWPPPRGARSRVTAGYAAKVGREVRIPA